jgi:AcrR family transcriptional regulator
MTRKYELKRRAERQAETRRRIVEATVALHTSLGPAQTSISAIAERAGVQRHTVYAHFPDEASLYQACTSHWDKAHPFPDPAPWAANTDPHKRLARVLADVYDWYAGVADDLELIVRDASVVPPVARYLDDMGDEMASLADRLAAGLGRSRSVRAAVGHALAFETWRSLVGREGLTNAQAARAMLRFVKNA